MRIPISLAFLMLVSISAFSQGPAQKVYETERAFEKMVAEKGINAGFIEYLAPDGVMFMPDRANGIEAWKARPISPAVLTWNPILIEVASNGVLAYSIGNSIYRPKGKDDTNAFAGHYLSVWVKRPNGEYRAVLDTGINHEKPASVPVEWKSPADTGLDSNDKKVSAADSSTGFYQSVESDGAGKAFKSYLADDAIVMREGMQPFFGKKAAIDYLGDQKVRLKFAKLKSFMEAADLAYVHSGYTMTDKAGKETERGNFVQVWKFRKGKWLIVADVLIPLPKADK
jgi:ketosteroid isomerase-like protein